MEKKTPKKKRKIHLETWLIYKLRRLSMMWPEKTEAFRGARIERGVYKCAGCEGEFKRKQVYADHIKPIVDPKKGFENWDKLIKRLFCMASGYQILCKSCHDDKTQEENEIRKKYRKKG